MKMHPLIVLLKNLSLHLGFILSLILPCTLFVSCQKGSDDKPAAKSSVLLDVEKQVPTSVCSNQMLQLHNLFRDTKDNAKKVYASLQTDVANSALQLTYKELNLKQAKNCKALSNQFTSDKTTACLMSENQKTIDNSIYQSTVESSCKDVVDWVKKMKLPDGATNDDHRELAMVFTFNKSSQSLLQRGEAVEFTYLANRTIKKGRDQFRQDILEGNTACSFQIAAATSLKEIQFTAISEMPDSQVDLDFEFQGSLFSMALEDTQKMILGMTCFNMTISADANKKELLQKAFGNLVEISNKFVKSEQTAENDKTDIKLNKDVAPKVPDSNINLNDKNKELIMANDEKQKIAAVAIDDMITKAKLVIHDVVADSMNEVKSTAAEVSAASIVNIQNAALEVSNKSIDHAAEVATQVSKVVIQDAKAAANEVVTQSVATAKTAVVDTIKEPFLYVGDKTVAVKNAIVKSTKTAVNYITDKAIEVKNILINPTSSKDYWSNFFASKSEKKTL